MRAGRFIPILAAAVALGLAAGSDAFAQSAAPRQVTPEKQAEAGRPGRPPRLDRTQRLDALYEALKRAPSAQVAQAVENRIEALRLESGSDTADLLISRARTVVEAKDYEVALQLLDALIELEPGFTEAYAQRATVYYLRKEFARALADLRVVVAREPRHYTSLSGLGVILQDIGEYKYALEAFRRALAIHPHLKAIPEFIRKLEVQVEGREI